MFKTDTYKMILITVISCIAILIALPRIDIKYDNSYFKIDSYIGGYKFLIPFINKEVDLVELDKGLDIKGGVKLVIKLDTSSLPESSRSQAVSSAKDIIQRRVNFLGVSETSIVSSKVGNEDRLIVEIPGESDVDQAVQRIGSTAQLRFKTIDKKVAWPITDYTNVDFENIFIDSGITGKDLISADVAFDPQTNQPVIQLRFTNQGREQFSRLLKENIERPIGIFLDNDLLQMPIVSKEIANSVVFDPTITGVSLEEAKQISSLLKAGALPVPIEIISQSLIGPTLGQDAIDISIKAGLIGLGVVFIFMILSYGKLGVIANINLIIYVAIVIAIFKILNVVITLPGIAGFVFSIGVACDASILIFERIKEELRWGKTLPVAINNGFDRAWSSIKDSNLTTLLTAIILFQFGTGFIKGFGLTLSIGILVSIVSCVYFSRVMIKLFIKDINFK